MDSQAVQRMPVLVVCNKSDMEECASAECIRELTADERHRGDLALVPVSALQGLNVERCIRWLLTALTRNSNFLFYWISRLQNEFFDALKGIFGSARLAPSFSRLEANLGKTIR